MFLVKYYLYIIWYHISFNTIFIRNLKWYNNNTQHKRGKISRNLKMEES